MGFILAHEGSRRHHKDGDEQKLSKDARLDGKAPVRKIKSRRCNEGVESVVCIDDHWVGQENTMYSCEDVREFTFCALTQTTLKTPE